MLLYNVSNEDALELTNAIIEVDMCRGLYESAIVNAECSPIALNTIIDYYIYVQKIHNDIWSNILSKYVEKDIINNSFSTLKFDPDKKVIFQAKTKKYEKIIIELSDNDAFALEYLIFAHDGIKFSVDQFAYSERNYSQEHYSMLINTLIEKHTALIKKLNEILLEYNYRNIIINDFSLNEKVLTIDRR